MSQYCQKCGTENEDGAKFCKSCGFGLTIESVKPNNENNSNAIFQILKKVTIWIVAAIVAFFLIIVLLHFNERSAITDLKDKCVSDDAQACYQLGTFKQGYDGVLGLTHNLHYTEQEEALVKSCRLGNADACYEAGRNASQYDVQSPIGKEYYRQGCLLKDGRSCWWYGNYELSCGYGYEEGCTYNKVYQSTPL